MKSLLVIGNINSPFTKTYISAYKKAFPEVRIDCLTLKIPDLDSVDNVDNIYINHFSNLWIKHIGKRARIGWVIGIALWTLFRQNKIKYDLIQVHYINIIHHYAYGLYKLSCKKLASVFWGSDLNKCTRVDILQKLISKSDMINCQTKFMENKIKSYLSPSFLKKKTFTNNLFGLQLLDTIENIRDDHETQSLLIKELDLPQGKEIIVIGHNASPAQQHLEIIDALDRIKFKNTLFLFPMTYSGNNNYRSKVSQRLKQSQLDYRILQDYIPHNTMAALCIKTSIFVQLLEDDALSGSMQEHIYAGSTVITGAWLNYQLLTEQGVKIFQIQQVSEVANKISQLRDIPKLTNAELLNNANIIAKLSKWDNVIQGWHAMLTDKKGI
ncbi:hypothetical protein QX776_00670 [Alteromonadaceae bacterium BrNp21-10]|nr:hypothetical protein [Alteromonadaceae bacterium BrNp21-10]